MKVRDGEVDCVVSLRERLADDEAVLGTFVTLAAPEVVELAGWVGLDFVVLDLEHGGLSADSIAPAVRAAEGADLDVIVRIPDVRRGVILTALDAGAAGIQVPQVAQPKQARQAVRQSRFPPEGERGAALGRSARFGLQGVDDYFREANANTIVTVQCESRNALERVEELADVDGVDVVFLGPFDYSVSIGKPGKLDNDEVETAAGRIVEATRDRPARPGVFVTDLDVLRRRHEQGFTYFVLSSDVHLLMNRFLNARSSFDALEST